MVFGVYSFFNGNPISKYKFKHDASHYLEMIYIDKKFKVEEVYFSFKSSSFGKQDFTLYFYFVDDKNGKLYSVYINDDGIMTDSYKS